MNHIGTRTLKTRRLILRHFAPGDALEMFESWTNDPEVTRFLTWPPHGTVDNTQTVLNRWLSDYEQPDTYRWAITEAASGALLGSIDAVRVDTHNRCAEIGYCMTKRLWGQGIMTEALRAVVAYLLDEVGLNRVCACHHPLNPASGRVMQKAGMQYEGIARKVSIDRAGNPYDVCWYAIVQGDPHPSIIEYQEIKTKHEDK